MKGKTIPASEFPRTHRPSGARHSTDLSGVHEQHGSGMPVAPLPIFRFSPGSRQAARVARLLNS